MAISDLIERPAGKQKGPKASPKPKAKPKKKQPLPAPAETGWYRDEVFPGGIVIRIWLKKCTWCGRPLQQANNYFCQSCGQLSG